VLILPIKICDQGSIRYVRIAHHIRASSNIAVFSTTKLLPIYSYIPTKKRPGYCILHIAYHTTVIITTAKRSVNDTVNTANVLKPTVSSIQGLQASALFSFRYCDFNNSFTTLHLTQHAIYSPIQSAHNA
jgi:hypothetical protein